MKGEASSDSWDTLSMHDVAGIFSPPKICCRAGARGLRGGWNLDSDALCSLSRKLWDLSNETDKKKTWNLFYKTNPKLFITFLPRVCSGLEFKSGRHGSEHVCLLFVLSSHVDDLICVGPRSGLDIFLAKLKCAYELTSTFLGPDARQEQEGKFLG